MENIYTTNKDNFEFNLLCKKTLGNVNDLHGRYYLKGKEYKAKLEIYPPKSMEDMRTVWVSFLNQEHGNRFNVNSKLHWDNFKEYFYCPLERERSIKIKKIVKS